MSRPRLAPSTFSAGSPMILAAGSVRNPYWSTGVTDSPSAESASNTRMPASSERYAGAGPASKSPTSLSVATSKTATLPRSGCGTKTCRSSLRLICMLRPSAIGCERRVLARSGLSGSAIAASRLS
jgi:hypothetical protein